MANYREQIQKALKLNNEGMFPTINISGPEESGPLPVSPECAAVLINELDCYIRRNGLGNIEWAEKRDTKNNLYYETNYKGEEFRVLRLHKHAWKLIKKSNFREMTYTGERQNAFAHFDMLVQEGVF